MLKEWRSIGDKRYLHVWTAYYLSLNSILFFWLINLKTCFFSCPLSNSSIYSSLNVIGHLQSLASFFPLSLYSWAVININFIFMVCPISSFLYISSPTTFTSVNSLLGRWTSGGAFRALHCSRDGKTSPKSRKPHTRSTESENHCIKNLGMFLKNCHNFGIFC